MLVYVQLGIASGLYAQESKNCHCFHLQLTLKHALKFAHIFYPLHDAYIQNSERAKCKSLIPQKDLYVSSTLSFSTTTPIVS